MKLSISTDSNVDMSLADLIKKNKTKGNKKPGQNRGNKKNAGQGQKRNNNALRGTKSGGVQKKRSMGGARRGNARGGFRPKVAQRQFTPAQGGSSKLDIANLDFNVTDNDIRELFSEFGQIKSSGIHYGSNGISLGTAHVHFANRSSALNAHRRYNGVHLDGRPMRISIKEAVTQQPMQRGGFGGMRGGRRPQNNRAQNNQRKGQGQGQKRKPQNQQRKGQQQKKGGGKAKAAKQAPPTIEQLNAQLDEYLNQASK